MGLGGLPSLASDPLPRHGDVVPDDTTARLRDLEQAVNLLASAVLGTGEFWTFDGTILSPVTVPPFSQFGVQADNGTDTLSLLMATGVIDTKVTNDADASIKGELSQAETGLNYDANDGTDTIHVELTTARTQIENTGTAQIQFDGESDVRLTTTAGVAKLSSTSGHAHIEGTLIEHAGQVGTNQAASATVAVGTLNHKIPIYDNSGSLLGYLPVYATIT